MYSWQIQLVLLPTIEERRQNGELKEGTYETYITGEKFIYTGELNEEGKPCGKGIMKNSYGLDTVYGRQFEGTWLDGEKLIVAESWQKGKEVFEYHGSR